MRKTTKMKAKTGQVLPGDLRPGMLVRVGDTWECVALAPFPFTNRGGEAVVAVYIGGVAAAPGSYSLSATKEREAVTDAATVRLTKPQAELLRLAAAGRVSFSQSNHGYVAPSHAHRDMFETYVGGKKSNRTLAGNALYDLGMIDIDRRTESPKVVLTAAADRWLAAHPA